MNKELKPFKHGEENTHCCCDKRLKEEGGQARCCYCNPHNDCKLNVKQITREILNFKLRLDKINLIKMLAKT